PNLSCPMYRLLVFLAVVPACSTPAWAGDFYDFVSISHPQENDEFPKISDVAGSGYLYFSHLDRREDVQVRVRLYRPRDRDFEIVHELMGEITAGVPSDSCQYKFSFGGKQPIKDGKYLLVVECADVRQAAPKWIASALQFLTVAAAQ